MMDQETEMSDANRAVERVTAHVADVLQGNCTQIIKAWFARTQEHPRLASIILSFEERTFYLHRLLQDLMIPVARYRSRLRPPKSGSYTSEQL